MKQLILIATLLFSATGFAGEFTYECQGISPYVEGEKVIVVVDANKATLHSSAGRLFQGPQDNSYIPRSRKNFARFEIGETMSLLAERALLEGGYELKHGGYGGRIQTESSNYDKYVRSDYLCKRQ
ncbi:hypothetical protein [Bdellovibrio sp. HCB2-146]|uniref:hypothetical protein n=1 Tax=Bdellovibrio sp. HCB2-146 TaxID=3394362 RepID=UPI0039BCC5B5